MYNCSSSSTFLITRALQAFIGGYFGEGSGPVFIENLECSGHENHLDNCSSSGLFATSCRHSDDVSVSCLSEFNYFYWITMCIVLKIYKDTNELRLQSMNVDVLHVD